MPTEFSKPNLVTNMSDGIDRYSGPDINQAPSRLTGFPRSGSKSHQHDAGMAFAAFCDREQPVATAGDPQPTVYILDPDEEELIPEAERQMFQEWWIEVGLEPAVQWSLRP